MIKPSDRETYRVAVDIDSLLLLLLLHQPYYALNKFMCVYIYIEQYIYIKRTNAYAQKDEQKIVPTTLTQTCLRLLTAARYCPKTSVFASDEKAKEKIYSSFSFFRAVGEAGEKRLWVSIKTARKWNNSIIITDLLGTTALYVPMLRTTATYSYIRTYHNSSFTVAKWYFFGTHTL